MPEPVIGRPPVRCVGLHDEDRARLDTIIRLLTQLVGKENEMGEALNALVAQVEAQTTVELSAIALIQGLADELKKAGTDPVAIADLTAKLKNSADALAAAITANTPAAPPAP